MSLRTSHAAAITAAGAALITGLLVYAPFSQADPVGDPSPPCPTDATCVPAPAPQSVARTPLAPQSVVLTPRAPQSVLLAPPPAPH